MDKVKSTLIFFENIYDPLSFPKLSWIAHKEYTVEFEQPSSYWAKDEAGKLRGIEKKYEGELFAKILYKENKI